MKVFYHSFFLLALLLPMLGFAQRNCSAMEVLERLKAEDPTLEGRMQAIERHTEEFLQSDAVKSRAVITIPVVVHVVYRTSTENISDAQIQSQIDVLNEDFQALNTDISNVPSVFQSLVGNVEIEFCLAKRDPNGNATSGIDRTQSTRTSWGTNDRVKKASQGGVNPWDASKYLNLWVCNIGGSILGYAQFPGGSAATDGVVIDYRYFGTIGTATSPFDEGRTATHEVGHWLNLRHIWGDISCGSDQVNDTPAHNAANYNCPTYPHLSTCSGTPVEMTMNYMDYTNDNCMYMFTAGQVARARAVLSPGGARASLLSSNGCQPPGGGGTTCALPSGLNATGITTTSATLNWGSVSGATSYKVRIRKVSTSTWSNFTSNTTSYNATALTADTDYEFQIQTVCGASTSTDYAAANFTTQDVVGPPNCTDTYENNNSRNTAKTISADIPIRALINTSQDEDWFKFTVTSTFRNIRVRLTNLPADYDLRLYRNNNSVGISENDGTAEEEIIYNGGSSTATYYLRVSGYNGAFNASNCYSLYVETSSSGFRETTDGVIPDAAEVQEFQLFPNPASDELTLDIPVESETPTQISIFDLSGKRVQTTTADLTKGNTIAKVNTSALAAGMYVVRVQNGNFISTQKFIISR